MSAISIIEFYTRLGVNPYVYIAILAGVAAVFLIIAATAQIFFSKRLYKKMESDSGEEIAWVKVVVSEIGSLRERKVSVTFADEEDKEYVFNLTNTEATFLSKGEAGVLKYRGVKYLGFGPVNDEEIGL